MCKFHLKPFCCCNSLLAILNVIKDSGLYDSCNSIISFEGYFLWSIITNGDSYTNHTYKLGLSMSRANEICCQDSDSSIKSE